MSNVMENVTKLIRSASLGDVADVDKHLNGGVSVNSQDCEGVTALQASAVCGHSEVIKLLLLRSASVDLPNVCGWTPLMLAARYGHTEAMSVLLKHRAKVNIFNKIGLTPVGAAVWSGQISSVKVLLEAGAVVDHDPVGDMGPSECDLTPIMIASLLGYDAILQLLLEKGAPVNHLSTVTGWSPLMLAACNGHRQTVQLLLQWGADVNITDICGRNALDIALLKGKCDVKALLENMTLDRSSFTSGKEIEFLEAVQNGDSYRVKLMLKEDKNNANLADPKEGTSALMLASMLGYIEIVQSLVYNGADVNAQDSKTGWTALMQAVFYKHTKVVKYLLEFGADISICAHNGYTVLDLARYLDDSDHSIISALNAKMKTSLVDQKINEMASHVLPRSKSNSCHLDNRVSKRRSSQSSRFKIWIEDVAGRFPTIFSKTASNCGDRSPRIPALEFDSTDDVFEQNTAPETPNGSKAMLSLSALKSPHRYLANNLRKHSLEPITPPLLCTPSTNAVDDVFSFNTVKQNKNNQQKNSFCLKTPHLLKNYAKMSPANQVKDCMRQRLRNSSSQNTVSGESQVLVKYERNLSDASEVCLQNSNQPSNKLAVSESMEGVANKVSVQSIKCTEKTYMIKSLLTDTSVGLSQILNSESLQKHVKVFKEQEVDIEAFKCLTEEDLNELGINTVASREKLLELVNQLKSSDMLENDL